MNIEFIGMACALGLSAMGSAFGSGFAAQASVGAWKKCYANGKPAPFIMVAFSGAPLTQTIYGFLLMNFIRSAVEGGCDAALAMFTGIFAGLAIGLSAFFQGKVAAASADALGETGKGTANFFIVIGIIETVALFTLVFSNFHLLENKVARWGTLRKEGAPGRLLYLSLISSRKRCNPCGYAVFSLLRSVRCCWKASSISSGVSSWRMPTPL